MDSTRQQRLYFGNIPFTKTEDDVRNLFSDCGTITDLKIIKRQEVSQGYGFITFDSTEAVTEALKKNGQSVDGRPMKVNSAYKKDPNTGQKQTNRLFVKNIPKTATEEQIRAAFSAHGTVTQVRIKKDYNTGESRGFAFIDLQTHDEAKAALALNSSQVLGGEPLVVNFAREQVPNQFGMGPGGPQGFGHMDRYAPYGGFPQQQYGGYGAYQQPAYGGYGQQPYGGYPQQRW